MSSTPVSDAEVWGALEELRQRHRAGRQGLLAERAGPLEQLLAAGEQAAERQPEEMSELLAWGRMLLADVRQEQGRGSEGLALVERARAVLVGGEDREGAARCSLVAAEIHLQHGDLGEALAEAQRGFDELLEAPGLDRVRIGLHNTRGRALVELDEPLEAIRAYQAGLELCQGADQLVNKARLTVNVGALQQVTGDSASALLSYQDALALFEASGGEADPETRAIVHHNLAALHHSEDDHGRSLEQAEAALGLYTRLGLPVGVAAARNACIQALTGLDRHAEAEAVASRSVAELAGWSGLDQARDALASLADRLWDLGLLEDLRKVTERMAERLDPTDVGAVHGLRVWDLRLRGMGEEPESWPALLAESLDLVEIGERSTDPNLVLDALELAVDLHERATDLRTALDLQRRLTTLQSARLYHMMDRRLEPDVSAAEPQRSGVRPQDLDVRVRARMEQLEAALRRVEREESARVEAQEREGVLEQDLQRALRLESLGRLAGGVAHDFNNLLTVIRGNAERLRGAHDLGAVGDILTAAAQGQQIVGQLLAFGRRQDLHLERLRGDDVVVALEPLLETLLEEDLQIDFRPGAPAAVVRVDRAKLESVLLNLLLNAREAMGEGGRIQLVTELRTTGDGPRYVIGVRDEGHGILAEHQDVIFDPFFTTRSEGEGSGLGLASALGIARRLGGDLRLVETSRFGSLFELALPLASDVQAEAVEASTGSRAGLHEAADSASLDGVRVVVVEDNEAIGRLVRVELERHGAQVLVAADGRKGLELLATGEAPDLVVCDVIMPGMGGPELYRRLHELGRAVPFLFTSGYPDRWSLEEFEDHGRVAFLPKPFDLATLRRLALELLA